MEYLGQNPWEAWTTNHFGILAKNKESHGVPIKNYEAWSQEFHVYEVEWTPDIIKWYIDGKFVFQTMRGKDRDGMHTALCSQYWKPKLVMAGLVTLTTAKYDQAR